MLEIKITLATAAQLDAVTSGLEILADMLAGSSKDGTPAEQAENAASFRAANQALAIVRGGK